MHQPLARTIDAAFHGADGAAADFRRLLIGKARGADQDQRFALVRRELFERSVEIGEIEVALLLGMGDQPRGCLAIGVLHLATRLAVLAEIGVAHDCEEPGAQVRTFGEGRMRGPGLHQRFLNQIVRPVAAA